MALEKVSFAKPTVPQPRLSAKYVPGVHSKRYWTEAEKQVLRDHFEEKGAQYCRAQLPGRSTGSIYQTARKLGLKGNPNVEAVRRREHHRNDPALDERIREAWIGPSGTKKGEVHALADELNVPRWWLSKRALALGLTLPRMIKEPPWTPAELDLLKRVPRHDPSKAAKIFSEHGFTRSPNAIMVKCKRAGLSRRYKESLSATACGRILGVDGKTFTTWILKGIILAEKRETKRLPQQGGHPWSIGRAYFRQWIIDNVERIDFRKVGKFALVEILTAGAAT